MLDIHPQFIVDNTQTQQAVVLQINEWKNILEKLEMLEDIEAYDNSKKNPSEILLFEDAIKEIEVSHT